MSDPLPYPRPYWLEHCPPLPDVIDETNVKAVLNTLSRSQVVLQTLADRSRRRLKINEALLLEQIANGTIMPMSDMAESIIHAAANAKYQRHLAL